MMARRMIAPRSADKGRARASDTAGSIRSGCAAQLRCPKSQRWYSFLLDADLVLHQKTVAQIAADFLKYPDIATVFGSYDDSPCGEQLLVTI